MLSDGSEDAQTDEPGQESVGGRGLGIGDELDVDEDDDFEFSVDDSETNQDNSINEMMKAANADSVNPCSIICNSVFIGIFILH